MKESDRVILELSFPSKLNVKRESIRAQDLFFPFLKVVYSITKITVGEMEGKKIGENATNKFIPLSKYLVFY